jgi:hypothetical protein
VSWSSRLKNDRRVGKGHYKIYQYFLKYRKNNPILSTFRNQGCFAKGGAKVSLYQRCFALPTVLRFTNGASLYQRWIFFCSTFPKSGFPKSGYSFAPLFLKVDFLKVDFLKVDFLKVDFLKVDFLKVDFLKVDFLKVDIVLLHFF